MVRHRRGHVGRSNGAFSEIVPQAFHRFPGLLILAATGPRNTAESNTAGYGPELLSVSPAANWE